jgi:hypothetical protein
VVAHATTFTNQLATKAIFAADGGNPEFWLRIDDALKQIRAARPLAGWAMFLSEIPSTL